MEETPLIQLAGHAVMYQLVNIMLLINEFTTIHQYVYVIIIIYNNPLI